MNQLKNFTPLMFVMSLSLLVISSPLSAADNGQPGQNQASEHDEKRMETQKPGQSSGNTSQQKSQQQSGADEGQRLSPDHHQSDYGSYKENDLKVDHHNSRDHTDAMH
jgi:hypothetical protein